MVRESVNKTLLGLRCTTPSRMHRSWVPEDGLRCILSDLQRDDGGVRESTVDGVGRDRRTRTFRTRSHGRSDEGLGTMGLGHPLFTRIKIR